MVYVFKDKGIDGLLKNNFLFALPFQENKNKCYYQSFSHFQTA